MSALMPTVALVTVLMLGVDSLHAQPVLTVAKRQLGAVTHATDKILQIRASPEDLSLLPTKEPVLKQMAEFYNSFSEKAYDRKIEIQSGHIVAPLPVAKYDQMSQKFSTEMERVRHRLDQLGRQKAQSSHDKKT
ncbi:hypothetical protein V8E36_007261 [Tilletia maclaganii]